MILFLEILLCFLALCGISYLLRDAYRLWQARKLSGPHFVLICRHTSFANRQDMRRSLLQLSSFLTHPEARHLVREVLITDAAPKELVSLYEAARDLPIGFDCIREDEISPRL